MVNSNVKLNIASKVVGNFPQFEEMENTLSNMQEKVGGYVECVCLPQNINMWINDESAINGMQLNLLIISEGMENTPIFGNVLFTSVDEEGDTTSLTKEQMIWLSQRFQIVGESRPDADSNKNFVFGLFID